MSLFDTRYEDLPDTVPLFPVTGALLLPRGNLPLNVYEPRYLNMVEDALAKDRIIGMIQAENPDDHSENPSLYQIGCAGRIVHFEETDDGRFLITLKGICRYDILTEQPVHQGYRIADTDWSAYAADMTIPPDGEIDRQHLFTLLKNYFNHQGIDAQWDSLGNAPDERLINSLAMICPFTPIEKQVLLLAENLASRCDVLKALLEMASVGDDSDSSHQ